MRKQTRPEAPQDFALHSTKWSQQWADLRAKNPAAAFNWYESGGRSARDMALPTLKQMTQDHCAFCDVFPFDDSSNEPVEHFKPKSLPEFYHEAYAWENLFYCCGFCQKSKKEQWNPRLLRPDAPDYDFQHYFRFTYSTGKIAPNPVLKMIDPDAWECARVTIDLYGLDKPVKRRRRMKALRDWTNLKNRVIDHRPYRDFIEGDSLLEKS